MDLSERVRREVREKEVDFGKDSALEAAKRFYEVVRDAGVSRKKSYGIAPPDTIGRRAYEATMAFSRPESEL